MPGGRRKYNRIKSKEEEDADDIEKAAANDDDEPFSVIIMDPAQNKFEVGGVDRTWTVPKLMSKSPRLIGWDDERIER